jgi:Zn-finger nucleic acid-binding protein
MSVPPTQPPTQPTTDMRCPKCQGSMRTYERNGIHLEQCDSCRGIFLDFGELEALTQLESRFSAAPPPAMPPPMPQPGYGYGPGWGQRGDRHYRKGGFGRLFFSS